MPSKNLKPRIFNSRHERDIEKGVALNNFFCNQTQCCISYLNKKTVKVNIYLKKILVALNISGYSATSFLNFRQ